MVRKDSFRSIKSALLLASAVVPLWATQAMAAPQRAIEIPAGDAAQTIPDLARQSGLQVLAPNADLRGVRTRAVRGTLDPVDALRQMLAGTGLSVTQTDAGTVSISRSGQQPVAESASRDDTSVAAGSDVVVTGSRIRRAGYDTLEAAIVTDGQQIKRRGYTNVVEALNDTPGFASSGVNQTGLTQNDLNSGQNFADFFGLGSQRTLTLVNGRRFVSSNTISSTGGTFAGSQVDLNLIPTDLIDRVETVAIGGAPIYGSDAIAGTVNIILKQNYHGLRIGGQAGITQRGDAPNYALRALAGVNFAEGRGNIAIAGEYDRQDGILLSARTGYHYRPGAAPSFVKDAVYDFFTDAGLPYTNGLANITNAAGQPLQFSGNTLVPYVQGKLFSFPLYDGGDGFRFADHESLLSPTERYIGNVIAHYDLTPGVTLFAEGSYAHSEGRELSELAALVSPIFGNQAVLSINNPYLSQSARDTLIANGVTNTFVLGRNLSDLEDRDGGVFKTTIELFRGVGGLRGKFDLFGAPAGWDVSVNYGRSRGYSTSKAIDPTRFTQAIDAVRDANGNIVCRSGGSCVPLNLFGYNQFSDAAADYVLVRGHTVSLNQQFVATANLNGQMPFRISTQPIDFNIGVEYRRESGSFQPDAVLLNPPAGISFLAPYLPASGSYHTKEVYGELSVPIISPDQDVPVIKSLSAEGAARYVDNSLTGGDLTWSAGARFAPRLPGIFDGLLFRGVYTRAIRAPAITELFSGSSFTRGSVQDPCDALAYNTGVNPGVRAANCATALAAFGTTPQTFVSTTGQISPSGTTSGNPNLQNEKAKSWSVGVVYQPPLIRGLRLAVDYSHIQLTGGIQSPGISALIAACYDSASFPNDSSCGFFRRLRANEVGPGTANPNRVAGDIANGYNSTYVNLASIKFAGLIISADYTVPLAIAEKAEVQLGAKAFHNSRYEVKNSSASPVVSSEGSVNYPRWTGQFNLGYSDVRFDAQLQALWTSSAKIDLLATPAQLAPSENNVESYWRFNGTIGLKVADRFRFQIAIDNLFDRKPTVAQLNSGAYGRYDLLGRRYRFGVTADF